jgi:hypothetical protein
MARRGPTPGVLAAAFATLVLGAPASQARPPDAARRLAAIARDLDALGARYPQFAAFSPKSHLDVAGLRIDYAFHVGPPSGGGGWTGAVPQPARDGVWLHIDVHAPDSTLQLHTQPMTAPLCLGDRRVSFLLLEGGRTRPVGERIDAILRRHGVRDCPPAPGHIASTGGFGPN